MLGLNSEKQHITLIGMPASGKSFFGKKLADLLGWTFVDLDFEIEKQEQQTIPQIFVEKGEHYFRQSEQKVLQNTLKMQKIVLSTGGGTPCFFDNLKLIKQNSQSIF